MLQATVGQIFLFSSRTWTTLKRTETHIKLERSSGSVSGERVKTKQWDSISGGD